jgi:tetratricopeptide (TPR) repeat protein
VAAQYKLNLEKCVELAEPMLADKDKFPEAVFFLLSSHGYIALSHTFTKDYLKAANEARKAYGFMKDGFKMIEKNPEFYATSGLYDFYIEQYPETHPIVKPAMIFFANGNKKLGLDYLDVASKKAIFSKVEATYYLAHIYLKYENLPAKSLIYSTLLAEKYPNNLIFLMRNVEGLVLAGKYEEAIPKIEVLRKNPDKVYQLAANVFEGIIAEKSKKNDKLAAGFFWASFKFQHDEQYTKNYHAMAYAGIARIYNRSNDKKKAKEFYEKCLDIAEYKSLITEAKAFK